MRTVALEIAYDGSNYAGWQIQSNAVTVQGVIEDALGRILKKPVRLTYAGRTDTGVHALSQVGCFETDSAMTTVQFRSALNALLPKDIRIRRAERAPSRFHPRYWARMRWYRYIIWNGEEPVPFFNRYALWVRRPLDIGLLKGYCGELLGDHDYTSFASLEKGQNPRRRIYRCEITRKREFVVLDITANAFLRKMIRTIVGTVLELEKGRRDRTEIGEILSARDRGRAGRTAYAGGLYFVGACFPDFPVMSRFHGLD